MIAVISGDLINSQKIPKHQYDDMLYLLDQSLRFIANKFSGQYSVYRGDALQIQLPDPRDVCSAAILLYLQLKSANYSLRQSMAIGQLDNPRADIKTATGSAYTLSGQGLDTLNQLLILQIEHSSLDASFALNIDLINVLLDKISQKQANALFHYLTAVNNSHSQLAKELQTSRENVTKLLNLANYQLIERFLNYSKEAIQQLQGVKK
ncbi:hypothetical protein NQT69_00075 [Pseudoalteromonas shioyasakiensis]|uniref:hypothetical protein n=1 Tax=Pseudoalteromonas shioyasakiensis TaxID=1190813 RepID=UPI00211950A0|nr:hypothetical protein [Pseudoalteromonas shioyasakiensis]MCQ8876435.1 hypothetical protein [Pseudoalteromonas shioyasakiensis]